MTFKQDRHKRLLYLLVLLAACIGIFVSITIGYALTTEGEFKGVHTFNDDIVGQAPAGFTLNQGTGESYTVVSQYAANSGYKGVTTHKTVLRLQHTKYLQKGYAQLTFASPAIGNDQICEFWMCNPGPYSLNNIQIIVYFRNATAIVAGISLDAGKIEVFQSTGFTYVTSYTMNSWMHIRFEFDVTSRTFTVNVNESPLGTYSLGTTTQITNMQIWTEQWYNNPSDGTYNVYVDAIGYSWHPDYVTGDNLNMIGSETPGPFPDMILFVVVLLIATGLIVLGIIVGMSRKGKSDQRLPRSRGATVETVYDHTPPVQDQAIRSGRGSPNTMKRGNLNFCPYCGGMVSAEVMSKYNVSKHVRCPLCDTQIS